MERNKSQDMKVIKKLKITEILVMHSFKRKKKYTLPKFTYCIM